MVKKIVKLGMLTGLLISFFMAIGCFRSSFFKKTPEERLEWVYGKLASDLSLTEDQKQKSVKIKDEVIQKMRENKPDRDKLRKDVLDMVRSDKIDKASAGKIMDERFKKMQTMSQFFLDKFLEFHSLLTPEQRKKMADRMEKIHSKAGHHGMFF